MQNKTTKNWYFIAILQYWKFIEIIPNEDIKFVLKFISSKLKKKKITVLDKKKMFYPVLLAFKKNVLQ